MKSKLITMFAILLSFTLGFSDCAQAGATMPRVTTNSYEDSFPQIKGNYLVWQGRVGGDWEIFLCDISPETPTPIQITDNDYGDILPQTDGNYVVWLGFSQSGGEIFLYNISSGQTTAITNDTNVDSPPQIANGLVVWTSHEVTDSVEPGEIFLYNIGPPPTTTSLSASVDSDGTLDDSSPRINDESVIWVQTDDVGNTTLFIRDLVTGDTTSAPEGYVWPDSPQSDGGLTVLTRYDGSDREIFVYNRCARTYEQITVDDMEDTYPRISGNHIAWVGDEEIYLAAYTCDKCLSIRSPADGAVLPKKDPPTFTWASVGYNKFKVAFSGDPASTLTFPSGDDYLSETSFTPTEVEWTLIRVLQTKKGLIYFRVEGKDAEGNVGYSETRGFTIKKEKKKH